MIYIKLKAQRLLIGKNSKAFLASVLPFFMAVSLLGFNYYLLNYLFMSIKLNLILKIVATSLIVTYSFFLHSSVSCLCENFFYKRATGEYTEITPKMLFCSFMVRLLKISLFFFLAGVFFLPSSIVSLLAYTLKDKPYPKEIILSLIACAIMLFVVGLGSFYVVYKRFSKSYFVLFSREETNPLKVLSISAQLLEGNLLRYSLFCLSFIGWNILCTLVFPIIYVLPYRKCAKYVFFTEKKKTPKKIIETEKPIVFILNRT